MKKIFFLFTICLLISTHSASAQTLNCLDDYNKGIKVDTNFDSSVPSLESITTKYNSDGSVASEKKQIFFAPEQACNTTLNFAEDCKFTERKSPKDGYEFTFVCEKANQSGQFYVNENGGFGQFSCNGEPPYLFFGCDKP